MIADLRKAYLALHFHRHRCFWQGFRPRRIIVQTRLRLYVWTAPSSLRIEPTPPCLELTVGFWVAAGCRMLADESLE